MLSVIYAECNYAECCHADCCGAKNNDGDSNNKTDLSKRHFSQFKNTLTELEASGRHDT
jgi:hypothetical protein